MPLPKKLSRVINKFARRDRKIGKKFHPFINRPGDLALYILTANRYGGIKYDILAVINDWSAEFNQYRDQTQFSVSTTRQDFGPEANETFFDIINRAQFVGKANGELYAIKKGDTVQAHQFDFDYKFFASIERQMTFDLSEASEETLQ